MTTNGNFRVAGGFAGYSDAAADQTVLTERFEERFATEAEAVTRAREIAKQLRPGGAVIVEESIGAPEFNPMDDARFIGLVCRHPAGPWEISGQYWPNPEGVDLMPSAEEIAAQS